MKKVIVGLCGEGSSKAQANCKQENRQGKNDQPSSTVLGVYESRERAEQAHHEEVVDEEAEYVENYDEVATHDTNLGTLITYSSDDSYWTLV